MRAEAVADGLKPLGQMTGRELVRPRGEPDSGLDGLALGLLVPVEPHLRWPRAVGADLDEPRTELRVQDVVVVDPDAAFFLEEVVADGVRVHGSAAAGEHPLELLAGDDRDDPKPALALGLLEVLPNVIELAIIPPSSVGLS
jgi:hypothetical protein